MVVRIQGVEFRKSQIGKLEQMFFQVKGVQGFVGEDNGRWESPGVKKRGDLKMVDVDFNTYC
jgi:hypothetical protein